MSGTTDTLGIRMTLGGQQTVTQGMRDARGGVKLLRDEMRRADQDARKMSDGLNDAADGADGMGMKLLGLSGVAARAVGVIGLAAGGIVAMLATVGVKTAAANEQAETAFTNMLGSASAAKAYLAELKTFAAATPFELHDVELGAQRLMAMGVASRDVLPYLTAIGDAVSGMGGGADEINQVVNAIGQIQAKGKVQGDEIMQLTEAGIPALKILAAQYGVSAAEMSKMMEAGKVASKDALPKLIDGIENGTKATKGFGGMMEAQSKTLAGRWSTIKDLTTQGLAGAVEPLLPTLSTAMDWLAGKLPDGMKSLERASGNVAAALNILRPTFRILWEDAGVLGNAFTEGFRESGFSMDDFRGGAEGLEDVFDPKGPLVSGVADLAQGLGRVAGFLSMISAKTKKLQEIATIIDGMGQGKAEYDPVNIVVKRLTGGEVDLAKSGWIKDTKNPYSMRNPSGPTAGASASEIRSRISKAFPIAKSQPDRNGGNGQVIPLRPEVRGMLPDRDSSVTVVIPLDGQVLATSTVDNVRRLAARRK